MEVSGKFRAPAALPPGKEPLEGWVGPRAGLDAWGGIEKWYRTRMFRTVKSIPTAGKILTHFTTYQRFFGIRFNIILISPFRRLKFIVAHFAKRFQTTINYNILISASFSLLLLELLHVHFTRGIPTKILYVFSIVNSFISLS
jgi:hypothetical protein